MNELPESAPCLGLPKIDCIRRTANRRRQALRPADPKDLDFVLQEEHIPDGFLQGDVLAKERRHIILATEQQLGLLAKAEGWYMDGTFKLCRHPFTQLFSINVFVRREDCVKHVPVLFVIMSGRKARDYRKVFEKVIEIIAIP